MWQDIIAAISQNIFYEFSAIMLLAVVAGIIGLALKQPLIVTFIFVGVLVGPAVLDIIHSKEQVHLLAEFGISILLFIVGLKLDLRIIKSVGKIALLTGMGQVLFTSLFGFIIALGLGFSALHSFYIAVALTFSSTIIIVKLLSDKKEIDSLHGQIAIGFLIVQDIVVILVMIVLSAMRQSVETSLWQDVTRTAIGGSVLIGVTYVFGKWIIPRVSYKLAKSQELLTLFGVAWAVGLAALGEFVGFSGEVGAFLAGISLAASPFKDVLSGRLVSLRDFLLLFFFVNLGATLNLSTIGEQLAPSLVLSVFVLVGNPIIVLIIMGLMGYRRRTAFLAGLTVAQISEFSLIFAGLGLAVGHITESVLGLITLVGLITIGLSTYLILYSHRIYEVIAPALKIFERKNADQEDRHLQHVNESFNVILIGVGRFGKPLSIMFDEHPDIRYLAVDFDPGVVKSFKETNKPIIYGDLEDPELPNYLPLQDCRYIISTVNNADVSRQLVKCLRKAGYSGQIFLTASNEQELNDLSTCDADYVLQPQQMAATNFYNSYLKEQFSGSL
jgi:Kef-type K+ transport system membrane component KefB